MSKAELKGIDRRTGIAENSVGSSVHCVNLRNRGGCYRPVGEWKDVIDWREFKVKAVHIHSNNGWENLIGYSETSSYLYLIARKKDGIWAKCIDENNRLNVPIRYFENLVSINSIGNTLIISDGELNYYLLWKEGKYKYLGNNPPQIRLQFYTQPTDYKDYDNKERSGFRMFAGQSIGEYGDFIYARHTDAQKDTDAPSNELFLSGNGAEFATKEGNALHAALSKLIYENGDICQPTCMRAGVRLYDGTYINVTPQAYLFDGVINSDEVLATKGNALGWGDEILMMIGYGYNNGGVSLRQPVLRMRGRKVSYRFANTAEEFKDWEDVISSIDLFMSKPISPYQSEKLISEYSVIPTSDLDKLPSLLVNSSYPEIKFKLPMLTADEVTKQVKSNGVFYRLKKIEPKDISTEKVSLAQDIKDTYPILEQQEQLKDIAYEDRWGSSLTYVYNQRVHYAKIHSKNAYPYSMFNMVVNSLEDGSPRLVAYNVTVIDSNDERETVITGKGKIGFGFGLNPIISYATTSAKSIKIELLVQSGSSLIEYNKTFELEESSAFTNSIFVNDKLRTIFPILWDSKAISSDTTEDAWLKSKESKDTTGIDKPNELRISTVGNPFGVTSKETQSFDGDIIAMQASTDAISSAESGQSPTYVFTKKGVFAMIVGVEVAYTRVLPINRDVATNVISIDNAIAYLTEKDCKIINGRTARSISEPLEGDNPNDKETNSFSFVFDNTDWLDIIKECRLSYNYQYDEIYVETPNGYAYVFDLRTKQWSQRSLSQPKTVIGATNKTKYFSHFLNSYPFLYGFKLVDSGEPFNPQKLGDLNVMPINSLVGQLEDYTIKTEMNLLKSSYQPDGLIYFSNQDSAPIVESDKLRWYNCYTPHTLPVGLEQVIKDSRHYISAQNEVIVDMRVKLRDWDSTGSTANKPENWHTPIVRLMSAYGNVKQVFDLTCAGRAEKIGDDFTYWYGDIKVNMQEGEYLQFLTTSYKTMYASGVTFRSVKDQVDIPDVEESEDNPQPTTAPQEYYSNGVYIEMYDCSTETTTTKPYLWLQRPTAFGTEYEKKLVDIVLRCMLTGDKSTLAKVNAMVNVSLYSGNNPLSLDRRVLCKVRELNNKLDKKDVHFFRLPASNKFYAMRVEGKSNKQTELNYLELMLNRGLDTKLR